jgi:MATE family multidrug resistance protein
VVSGSRTEAAGATLTHRAVLAIAIPVMLSNLSTPLTGVVDTAVVGRIPGAAPIGAVAAGSLVFTFLFWAFGFLRMGTTGLTAQAHGAQDRDELRATLGRALLVALAAGMSLILLQWPIRAGAFAMLGASREVERLALGYFDVRIWAAPAALANYAILGWLIGLGRTDLGLIVQLFLNVTNMLLAILLVLILGWGVRGVALATVLAEYGATGVGCLIAARHLRALGGAWSLAGLLAPERLQRVMTVNLDIMIRSLALLAVFVWFTSNGARQGDAILAANAVLMHLVSLSAFFLDGMAFAAESLVGQAVGASRRAGLIRAARVTTAWATAVACMLSLVLSVCGVPIIDALTVDAEVRHTASRYLPWAAGVPLMGVWAFQLDGIFIGATRTADMRNAMLLSLAIFLAGWWLLRPLGNHGLWAALYVSYLARLGTLLWYYPRLVRDVGT